MIILQGKWGISGSLYPKSVLVGPEYSVTLNSGPITPDGTVPTNLGRSMNVNGSRMIIGTERTSSNYGSAHIYEFSGGSWVKQVNIYGGTNSSAPQLGRGVAIHGDWAAIGIPKLDKSGLNTVGGVYIHQKSTSWSATPTQIINYPLGDQNGDFGYAVDLTSDTLVVGAPFGDIGANTDRGQVFVYRLSGGTWSLEATLNADIYSTANAQFGRSLSIEGDRLMVGAPGESNGSVYYFQRTGTTWSSPTRIQGSSAASGMAFGFTMKIRGDRAVISAPGATVETNTTARVEGGRIYYYTYNGSSWVEQNILRVATSTSYTLQDAAYHNAARLGWSLDLHPTRNVIIAGAVKAGGTSTATTFGKVYMFEQVSGVWGATALNPSYFEVPSRSANDYFGFTCGFADGDKFVASSTGKNGFYSYT